MGWQELIVMLSGIETFAAAVYIAGVTILDNVESYKINILRKKIDKSLDNLRQE
ncbi:hypothetical protein K7Q49_004618 [Escherichia coli]|nr:hypothetical protein [Escherichia coli]